MTGRIGSNVCARGMARAARALALAVCAAAAVVPVVAMAHQEPPGTPSGSAPTTTSMTVTWAPATGATSYTLEVAADDAFAAIVGTYGPATNSQAVAGLSPNTLYWMRVSATGAGGTSEWSPTGFATTVPGAPGSPSYSATTSSGTTVSWTPPSGNATITAYALDRATDSGFTQDLVTTSAGASTTAPVAGLAASTQYWFRVRATNAAGTSASSTPSSVTTSAAPQTLLATGSDPTPSAPLCPGGAPAFVDALAFSSDPTADTVTALEVALGAGAGTAVALVEIRDGSGASLAPPRAAVPGGDTVTFGSASLPSPTAGASYRLYVTPQTHALTPPGSYSVAARVASFTPAAHAAQGSDSASTFTIDNAPLANATWSGVVSGSNQLELSWTNPAADSGAAVSHVVVLRRKTASAFLETLADGATPPGVGSTTAGGSAVVYSQAASAGAPVTFVDGGVLNGDAYVYRVYVQDACGNWNAGASTGPHVPAGTFRPEGSTIPGAPMISIANPLKGSTVSGTFRLQVRVANAVAQGGIPGLTPGSLAWSTDDGATWQTSGLVALPGFDIWSAGGTLTGRTWEVQVTPPVAGPYTLRAKVSSAVAANVLSNAVTVFHRAGGGAGTLLVRDNSSQLCSDCHALMGHTSETTDGARGSWSTTCRDCHAPHGTRNISLVAEAITPPAISAPQTPKAVVFQNKAGLADASFASAAANGPCQVCHTRTAYYLADGSGAAHYTTPCANCHKHTLRFTASCTGCHGTEARTSVDGADARQDAAPPAVAADAAVSSPGGGAHLAHVNQASLRGAPLHCEECHPSPNVHQLDLGLPSATDVLWPGLASAGGVTPAPAAGALDPSWPATPGCTNYCHGASLTRGGGSNRSPGWIGGPAQAACGTCHDVLPPVGGASAGVHPQNEVCATCHGAGYGYALGAGSLTAPAKAKHVDGTLDRPNGCTACHGNLTGTSGVVVASGSGEAAPGWDLDSVDTRGSSERAQVGVGAHGRHVNAGMMAAKACAVCHGSTPVDGDEAHANAAVAIGWSGPANAKGVAPTWTSPTCTNYCHSSGLPIGGAVTTRSATWTSTTALGCGDCHAATPATNAHAKHATAYGIGCRTCHATTAATSGSVVAGGGAHVSGGNDVGFDASDPYVAPAGYDPALYTCAATYCHSSGTDRDPAGGFAASTSPAWNAGGSGCAGCHAAGTALATGSHPGHLDNAAVIGANYGCEECHASTTADGSAIASTDLHVNMAADVTPAATLNYASGGCTTYCHSNGRDPAAVDPARQAVATWGVSTLGCNGCHGRGTAASGAPDYADGATLAEANTHSQHTGLLTDRTSCQRCHAGLVTADGTAIVGASHTNGTRDVVIAAAWDANGGTGADNYDPGTKTCAGVSCHGSRSPAWGTTLGCNGCHGSATPRTPVAGADPNLDAAPPVGMNGETQSTARAVGAHLPHVNQLTLRSGALACDECHLGATHEGTRQVAWGTLATTGGKVPAWNGTTCASTYCHGKWAGDATYAGTIVAPSWTGTAQAACGTCHKIAPTSSGHGAVTSTTNCGACHVGYDCTSGDLPACTVNPAEHLDGERDVGGPNCRTCHDPGIGARRPVLADFSLQSHHVGNGATMGGALTDNDCYVCHAEAVFADGAFGTGDLHIDGKIDLRDADDAVGYFQYDKAAVAASAGAVANWGSGNDVWRRETSGQTDDAVNSLNAVACSPSGAGCRKGLDRFCISCHDADGASDLATFWPAGASAMNPFADGTITNNYDQQNRSRVVDVASRVHDTARKADGSSFASRDRDGDITFSTTGSAPRRAATPAKNDPPEGVFSRHAIRGLSESVYDTTNATWDTATWWNRSIVTWNSTSVMGCADCHTVDGANGTSGNAHGSSSEYLLKSGTGTAAEGTTSTTVVCGRCHLGSAYGVHMGTGSSCNVWTQGSLGTARTGSNGNIYGYGCGNCHGGGPASKAAVTWNTATSGATGAGGFGTIHGTSQVLGIGVNGGAANQAYRATYRFTNGNSMRYYDPGTWWSETPTGSSTCYTLSGADSGWGGCTQHGSKGRADGAPISRPLAY